MWVLVFGCGGVAEPARERPAEEPPAPPEETGTVPPPPPAPFQTADTGAPTTPEAPTGALDGTWVSDCAHVDGEDALHGLALELDLTEAGGVVDGRGTFAYEVTVYQGGSTGGGGTVGTTTYPVSFPLAVSGALTAEGVSLTLRAGGARVPVIVEGGVPSGDELLLEVRYPKEGSRYACAMWRTSW